MYVFWEEEKAQPLYELLCNEVMDCRFRRTRIATRDMALATFANGIDTVRGAIDSVKEGQAKRARLVCRWRPQGAQSYDED